jgi:glycosyltransferase involved in cell wall biosynthesis
MVLGLFCLSLFMTIYPYLLFPMGVRFAAKAIRRPWRRGRQRFSVSLIISVFNEEQVIRGKLGNAAGLRYPADLLEIIVVSDGSTDATNKIVASFHDPRVVLLASPERAGKSAALNRAVSAARGDILLFTDANSMFPPHLLETLVADFADPEVGLVTGWTRYRKEDGEEESEGLYGRLERLTKEAESLISSCIGADGAVFAMRRELYRPLAHEDINDFVIPLQVVGQAKRVVLDPAAYCFEIPSPGIEKEFRRQIRITSRTVGAIMRNPGFLNPFSFGWFSLFLISHKLLRFLVPFFFAGTLINAMWLAGQSRWFALFALGQATFIAVGAAALRVSHFGRLGRISSLFILTISAQLLGWIRWASGKSDVIWTPQR